MDLPPHLCEVMAASIADPRVPVEYRPQFREYVVLMVEPSGERVQHVQGLFYCPWCGQALPSSLREQLFDELDRLSPSEIDDYFVALDEAPDQYRTGAWWQGRYDSNGNDL